MAALQLTGYTSIQTGASTTTGYARVTRFNGDEALFRMDVQIWIDQDAHDNGLSPIDGRSYQMPTPDVTGISSVYTFLQTQSEFAGSTLVA